MKLFDRNSHKDVLGVMVDGRDLRLAQLGWEHGEIVIRALESVTLQHRLGKLRTLKATAPLGQEADSKDVFGLEDQVMATDGESEPDVSEGDVSSALINVFSKYPLKKTHLAINTPEGQTTYYSFEDDFKLKGKKLKKRLREEIAPLAGGSVGSCLLDHFTSPTGEMTAVVFEGSLPLIEELLEIKAFLPGGAPYFALVQSNELALVNLARVALDLPESAISAMVYIGAEFSRVIILKSDHPLSFVQTIHEGYTSPQVCQTIFSKILLEQEEAGLPEIENLILAGEVGMTHAFEFFSKQFPEAKVQSFTPGPLNVNALKPEEIAVFPNFAIPVALAWQALEAKNDRFIPTDLLPPIIKEAQKYFKVAWHGFALLGFVFCCMALLSYQGLIKRRDIKVLQNSIRQKQETVESLTPELTVLDQIQGQIGNYRTNLDFLDSLIVDPGKWSRLFAQLTQDFHTVNDIWIEDIKSDPHGFDMIGKSLARDRIPKLAFGFDGAFLKRVTRVKTEDGDLTYEFEMTANVPAPQIKGNLCDSMIGGDRVASAVGNLTAAKPVEKPTPEPAPPVQTETIQKTEAQAPQPKSENTTQPEPVMPKTTKSAAESPPQKPPQLKSTPSVEVQTALANGKPSAAGKAKGRLETKTTQDQAVFSESYNKGIRLVRAGDTKGAIETFREAIAKDPQGSEAAASYYWIGECHFASGDYSSAVGDFETSLGFEVNAKHEAAMLMLGLTRLKLKQYDLAKSWFDKLLQEFPEGEFAPCAKTYLKGLAKIGK